MPFLLHWLSRRSLRFLHALGAWLGWAAYLASASYRRRLQANAALAGITAAQRRRSVAEAGKMGTEGLRLWLRPAGQPIADPIEWHGAALIDAALQAGRGLVLLTPHLGSFELAAQAYAERWGPARTAAAGTRAAGAGHRARRPWRRAPYAARAQARRGGRPAARPGAAARPGRVGAVLRPAGVHDDAGGRGRGFRIVLEPLAEPLPAAGSGEELQRAQAEAVNRAMESQIRQCPQQYLWGYNRYKVPRGSPPGAAAP